MRLEGELEPALAAPEFEAAAVLDEDLQGGDSIVEGAIATCQIADGHLQQPLLFLLHAV
jgi:hypothetical protein